jgi:hypothetical protein
MDELPEIANDLLSDDTECVKGDIGDNLNVVQADWNQTPG